LIPIFFIDFRSLVISENLNSFGIIHFMKNKTPLIVLTTLILGISIFLLTTKGSSFKIPKNDQVISSESLDQEKNSNNEATEVKPNLNQTIELPKQTSLSVPFLVQAPFGNWDATHEESCEEASLVMVRHYLLKDSVITPENGDREMLSLIDFENKNGYKVDVTVWQLNDIANSFYGLKTGRVIENPTITLIKQEISSGHPVIVPAAGKLLGNPNFRGGGPIYHMLVIKGYNNTQFVTNDPGTKRGQDYRYKYDILMNALHNWNESDITQGAKAVLVFD